MKKAQFWWAGAVFAALILGSPPAALGQRSPCPRVFSYQQENGQTVGEIELRNVGYGEHTLNVRMSLKTSTRTTSKGDIVLQDEQDVQLKVINGESIKYTVYFPVRSVVPKVTLISFDSQKLCEGPKEEFSGVGTEYISKISLESSLTIMKGSTNTARAKPKPNAPAKPRPNAPAKPRPNAYTQTRIKPASQSLRKPSYGGPSYPCGIPRPTAGNFIVNGFDTSPGDWPWLVTVNLRQEQKYVCTGALVSHNVVVTAAHCVFRGNIKRKAVEMLLEFGVYDRVNERQNVVSRNVKRIELPRGHEVTIPATHDLATLVIDKPVAFSKTIIPVCLWSGRRDLRDIITKNQKGSVVGWGMDELDVAATTDPRLIALPIVQFDICKNSHEHFNNIVKGLQYCAGPRDGRSGVCNGDSGGGMFFFRNNHWELKGIVSFGVHTARHTCDLNEYVVFTDVTHPHYTSWIEGIIDAESGTQVQVEEQVDY